MFGFSGDSAKFDYQSGGRDQWLARVQGVELSKITPAKIQEWKQSFLAGAGDEPLALRKARISVNTLNLDEMVTRGCQLIEAGLAGRVKIRWFAHHRSALVEILDKIF